MTVCDVCKAPATERAIVAAKGIDPRRNDESMFGLPFHFLDLCDTHNSDLVENWGLLK